MSTTVKEQNSPVVGKIQEIAKQKGVMKSFLAEQAGITPNMLSSILHGRKLITADKIQSIADALEINAGDLFLSNKKTLLGDSRVMCIGNKDYKRIVVVNELNEVLAVISGEKIVEKNGIRCILED